MKLAKTAEELESMITAELRGYPECETAGAVVIRPMGLSWDAALIDGAPTLSVECQQKLAEITNRLRQEFDLDVCDQ
jgi:hypothetical protein